MEKINLISKYENIDNVYSYFEFNNNSEDIEAFIDYIYSIIDYCDYFYYNGEITPKNIEKLIPNKLVDIITTHIFNEKQNITNFNNMLLFDIKEKNNKQTLKEKLRFNISDPDDREPIKITTDCINVANQTDFDGSQELDTTIVFVKENKILFNFNLYDGYLYDYSNNEIKTK